ncbi:MAG: saccharopine dehydrogenase [Burkholderiales bacterium PBB4]|nr:MAG: saccharopine dehydrogenase [Burkholderiales bacterium PBB4]
MGPPVTPVNWWHVRWLHEVLDPCSLLAARSADRVQALAAQLDGLPTQIADVSKPETVRALVERGDVLISTVGPFARFGEPAVQAAIAAGAIYIDSTGEPSFIRRIFEKHHHAAMAARTPLLTAFGYDWVPGNLAAALALKEAGEAATRVAVGYFSRGGGGISGGTRASMVDVMLQPSYVYRGGKLVAERSTARTRAFELIPGKSSFGVAVGASEQFALPAIHPSLLDVQVFLGMGGAKRMPWVSGFVNALAGIPGVRAALRSIAGHVVEGSTGGPEDSDRARSSSTILAETFSASGQKLTRVKLEGVNGYTFTAEIIAWGAMTALGQEVMGAGALGPVSAFGLAQLELGVREAGIRRV